MAGTAEAKSTHWTKEEIMCLKENVGKMTHGDIGKMLGRTKKAVRNKCWKLGLVNRENLWTVDEIEILKEAYINAGATGVVNLTKLASMMNRDKSNVCRKAKELGLKTNKNRFKVEEEDRKPSHKKGVSNAKYETEEERRKAISEALKEWHRENEHPRGMLGKTHSKEYCKRLSQMTKERWENMTPEQSEQRRIKQRKTRIKNGTLNPMANRSNPYSRARGGKRKDLNDTYFRSTWEANMARYYNFVGIKWEYEPRTFIFETIKRGSVSYTPDFYLPEEDRWVEVKGWMDEKSKTKLKRFEKYYPDEYKKLEIIGESEYREFAKYKRLIKNWEDV